MGQLWSANNLYYDELIRLISSGVYYDSMQVTNEHIVGTSGVLVHSPIVPGTMLLTNGSQSFTDQNSFTDTLAGTSGYLTYPTVIPGTLTLTNGTETFTDNGVGGLVSSLSSGDTGTIVYTTGAWSVGHWHGVGTKTATYKSSGYGTLSSSLSPHSGTINYSNGAWAVTGWYGTGNEYATYMAATTQSLVNLNWDEVLFPTIKGIDKLSPVKDKYYATEVSTLKNLTRLVGIEEYSKFVDLLQLIPEKFRGSVALQQLFYVLGLQVGTWIGKTNDLQTILDKYSVGDDYIQYLADLVGLDLLITPTTTYSNKQQQLLQVIDWYKMKGTYQALKVIAYTLGLNVTLWDLYTNDYINFTREPWYVGPPGTNPGSLTLDYYKSPHIGVDVNLIQILGTPPNYYFFDGANTYNSLVNYVERVRPVNVVPHYSLLLNPVTTISGAVEGDQYTTVSATSLTIPAQAACPVSETLTMYTEITYDPNTNLLMHFDGTQGLTSFTDVTGKTVTNYPNTFVDTVLLLHCDGSQGAVSFTDSEDAPKVVTNTANYDSYTKLMIHGSASPFIDSIGKTVTNTAVTLDAVNTILGKSSMAFNGTSADLSLAYSADWVYGTNPFCIEGEFIFRDTSYLNMIYSQNLDGNNVIEFYWNYSNLLTFVAYSGGNSAIGFTCPFTPVIGTTYHIEVERIDSGNTAASWNVSINGVAQTLTLVGGAWNGSLPDLTATTVYIGARGRTGQYFFKGNMTEVRISKGIARYPVTGFTPPITPFGQVYVDTSVKKFGTGSARFFGSGEYLSLADSTDWTFTGDFTIDFWLNIGNLIPPENSTYMLMSQFQDGINYWYLSWATSGGNYYLTSSWQYSYPTNSFIMHSSALSFAVNTWYHIAYVKNGSNYYWFVNGVNVSTAPSTNIGNPYQDLTAPLEIGRLNSGVVGQYYYLNGNIDELRISKGIARWTTGFRLPKIPYAKEAVYVDTVTSYDPYTEFISHFDGSLGQTSITDETGYYVNNTANYDTYTKLMIHGSELTAGTFTPTVGGTVTNTAVTLDSVNTILGQSSMLFNGTSAYLSLATATDWDLGSGNFTLEVDAIAIDLVGSPIFIARGFGSSGSYGWEFYTHSDGHIYFEYSTNGTNALGGSLGGAITTGVEHHVCIERSGNTLYAFVDGVATGTTLDMTGVTIYNNGLGLKIGDDGYNNWFHGNIGEVRVSKGIARYPTTGFTSPTAPFGQVYVDTTKALDYPGALMHFDASPISDVSGKIVTNTANYDSYTKLMIHGSASPFVDAIGKTIINTNVTLDSVNTLFGNSTMAFNGASAYLTGPLSSDFNFGTGDFTIDFWVNFNSLDLNTRVGLVSTRESDGLGWFQLVKDGSYGPPGSLRLIVQGIGGYGCDFWTTSVPTLTTGTWYHIAFVRSGNVPLIFINGVSQSVYINLPFSSYMDSAQGALLVGVERSASSFLAGNMGEIRISKGIARWISNFTLPTGPYGQAYVDTAVKQFGTGSARFLGGGEYLSLATSADWNFGSGALTIDGWFSFNSLVASTLIAQRNNGVNGWSLSFEGSDLKLYVVNSWPTAALSFQCSFTPTQGTLYHIALIRGWNNDANTWAITINGVYQTLTLNSGSYSITMPNVSSYLAVGINGDANTNGGFCGNIDELRISKGIARWTSNFTPPTSAYTDPLHPFGTGSARFLGCGEYLSLSNSPDFAFGAGDFTIDGWINISSGSGMIASKWYNPSSQNSWSWYFANSNALYFDYSTTGAGSVTKYVLWTPTLNTWYHVALVRHGNDLKFFVNGTQQGATQDLTGVTIFTSTSPVLIGTYNTAVNYFFCGNMDELRISKGIARWTSNFTPPTSAYTPDTVHYKFGTGSAYFDGASYLSLADSTDWNFGNGIFTVDNWYSFNDVVSQQVLFACYQDSSNYYYFQYASNVLLFGVVVSGAPTLRFECPFTPTAGTFYHIAVIRGWGGDVNTWAITVNGVHQPLTLDAGSYSITMPTLSGGYLYIGTFNTTQYFFMGNQDELRISKGIARWTSDFTPETSAYVLLPIYIYTGVPFSVGQNISVAYDNTHKIQGTVTSFNQTTGQMVVNVTYVVGTGTYSSWRIIGNIDTIALGGWISSLVNYDSAYSTGTVSINNGGATLTGVGTVWTQNVSAGAQIGFGTTNPASVSTWYTVSAVNGDTSITIASPVSSEAITGNSGTLANHPVVGGSVTLTNGTENFVDNGSNVLVSSLSSGYSGTINYTTGAWSVPHWIGSGGKTASYLVPSYTGSNISGSTYVVADYYDTTPKISYDTAQTTFYNSITIWKLGTDNAGVIPGSDFGSISHNWVLTNYGGSVTAPITVSIQNTYVEFSFQLPSTITQSSISELGLFQADGSTMNLGCTFPPISIVPGVALRVLVHVNFQ